jgi:sulfur-carrier protein
MKILIRTFARFREIFGDERTVDLPEGSTIATLLTMLGDESCEAGEALFSEDGELKRYVILMRNRHRMRRDEIEALALSEGDEIAILPPVAGG